MSFLGGVFYYFVVAVLTVFSIFQYAAEHFGKACFALIAAGVLLILNEIKRNARIVNNYQHCEFLTPFADSLMPQPGPQAPGSPEGGGNGGGTQRR